MQHENTYTTPAVVVDENAKKSQKFSPRKNDWALETLKRFDADFSLPPVMAPKKN